MTIAFSWIRDSNTWDSHSRVLNVLHTYELIATSMEKFTDHSLWVIHCLLEKLWIIVNTVNTFLISDCIASSCNWLIMQPTVPTTKSIHFPWHPCTSAMQISQIPPSGHKTSLVVVTYHRVKKARTYFCQMDRGITLKQVVEAKFLSVFYVVLRLLRTLLWLLLPCSPIHRLLCLKIPKWSTTSKYRDVQTSSSLSMKPNFRTQK